MAPTLKEVHATASASKASRGEMRKEEDDVDLDNVVVASVSDDNNNNNSNSNRQPRDDDDDEASPAPNDAPLAPSASSSTSIEIEMEDPASVPPDETAFLSPPHFSSSRAFHRDLAAFDLSMRCSICGELYKAPVTLLPCLHDFCSLCVRRHLQSTYTGMKRKANCPACHVPVRMPGSSDYERGILPNKQLEQRVDAYRRCRGELRRSLVRLDVLEKEKAAGILLRRTCGKDEDDSDGARKGRPRRTDGAREEEDEGNDGGGKRRCSKRARTEAVADDLARCSSASEARDDPSAAAALDRDRKVPPPPSSSRVPRRRLERKPATNYHGLRRKKLVELCRAEGLDARGGEAELRRRHADYVALHNSECDSEHPRSARELAREARSRERSIEMEAANADARKQSKFMKKLGDSMEACNSNDGGGVGRPTTGNESFDGVLNAGFARMVADLKRRKREGRKTDDVSAAMNSKEADDVQEGDGAVGVPRPAAPSDGNEVEDSAADAPAPSQAPGGPEDRRAEHGDAIPPSASVNSDERTMETTPQTVRPRRRRRSEGCPSPPSEPEMAETTITTTACGERRASSAGAASSKRLVPRARRRGDDPFAAFAPSSRVLSVGPWACGTCTYRNDRNTTRTAVCEMCGTARPKERAASSKEEEEVVNIDC